MTANFSPTMSSIKDMRPFRFWCQKVLPTVYDDSLSYYELLNKVVYYLNDMVDNVDLLNGNVTQLYDAYVLLEEYVNNYFDSQDFQEMVNNKLDEMAQDGTLTELMGFFYNQFNDGAYLEPATTLIGTCALPNGHTVCACQYADGYLYLTHHENDASNMHITKYTYPALEYVASAVVDDQMHGNGLGYDSVRNLLILSNGKNNQLENSASLYFIDPSTLEVDHVFKYSEFGNTSLSTFDISPDGTSGAALITGSNKILEYDVNPNNGVASIVRIHNLLNVGDGIRQDCSLSDTFYYQLMSNNSLPTYSNNQIVLYSFRTGYFKTLYLNKSGYDELEGISRIRTSNEVGLLIADVNGKIYFCDTSDRIIASGLLTKSDNVCAGKPQYMVTNPMQLNTLYGTEEFTVESDNITVTCMKKCLSFDMQNYSLRTLETMQDAWQVHFGWYYAPLRFGDRYFLTGTIATPYGILTVRYGYYHSVGQLIIQRVIYRSFVSDTVYSGLYDSEGDSTSAIETVLEYFISDNKNELQSNIKFYPEIYNISDYARTGNIWNVPLVGVSSED